MNVLEQNTLLSIQKLNDKILSKREYIALQCLNGILSNEKNISLEMEDKIKIAFDYADSFLKELK